MDDKQNVDMNEKQSQLQVEDSSRKSDLSEKPINMETTKLNATLANPLSGKSHERLMEDGEDFARKHGMEELVEEFRKGAVVAQDPTAFESLPMLSKEDKENLRREVEHKWEQPLRLYLLVICCSVAAAVQGMDETVINGAQLFYPDQFGIHQSGKADRNSWILGLVNSAPYLCCALIGCWLTEPLNAYFGRRGAIFITATISALACFWQGVTNSWPHLFIARFVLGLGIGPKSATVPVYAAECAPAPIRGALVMMWQMFTAFGIMLGNVSSLVFYHVPDKPHITGLRWRLMLGSAGVPALFVMSQVYFCPESPRWLLSKGRYRKAYEALYRLRGTPLRAARDLYYIHASLQAEDQLTRGRNRVAEMFTIPRNRRATLASFIVMFMQQFCGVNAIAYYSSNIFKQANFTDIPALLATFGFGLINWLFALPAVYTIDTFGRRNLLLVTFPLMALFLLMTGFGFFIPEEHPQARLGVIASGIYLFTMVYSPGEGPVPFTYSAEAFPLYIRNIGMSFATAVTWFFNFIVAITFPALSGAFTPQGAFGWYAAWNCAGWVAVLLAVPETKALSLEELDQVFSVSTRRHAIYQLREISILFKKHLLRRKDVKRQTPLYEVSGEKTFTPTGAAAA